MTPLVTTNQEREWVRSIRNATILHNKDNVTRTKAYLQLYAQHPELHWSLLAHLVSRNGGYQMTDLKGETLDSLLSPKNHATLFSFLETANAWIFQDAFPQLMWYALNKQRGFHIPSTLLRHFHVSVFNEAAWIFFLRSPATRKAFLTCALIENEQRMIEVRHLSRKESQAVVSSFPFRIQNVLPFTHVIFPYKKSVLLLSPRVRGVTVSQFELVTERIRIGRMLYTLLYSQKSTLKFAGNWAKETVHTGSREDLWPKIYSRHRTSSKKIWSPRLSSVWPAVNIPDWQPEDWCKTATLPDTFHYGQASYCRLTDHTSALRKATVALQTMDWIGDALHEFFQ